MLTINLKQAWGGGENPPTGWFFSLLCLNGSRKLKLDDFYHVLISFHLEYKPVPWNIHYSHGNAIVDKRLASFCLKIGRKVHSFCSNNKHLKITPCTKFQANRIKTKEVPIFYFFLLEQSLKCKLTS